MVSVDKTKISDQRYLFYSVLKKYLFFNLYVSYISKTLKIGQILTKTHHFNDKNTRNTAGYVIFMYFINIRVRT